MAAPERIAIAAAGAVTPIGPDLETFWSGLVTGVSGISQIERFDVSDLKVQRGLIPPTLHLEEPDPECDLDYVPGRARPGRPRIMLSTSMGFGGCNGAIVLEGA